MTDISRYFYEVSAGQCPDTTLDYATLTNLPFVCSLLRILLSVVVYIVLGAAPL